MKYMQRETRRFRHRASGGVESPANARARWRSSSRSRALRVSETAVELRAGLVEAAELGEKVAANARQEVIVLK